MRLGPAVSNQLPVVMPDWGFSRAWTKKTPISDPNGIHPNPVGRVELEFTIRSYDSQNADNQAAIATISWGGDSPEGEDLYQEVFLESRSGNFAQAREFKVENGRVVRANSWWTAVRDCVVGKCRGSMSLPSFLAPASG